VLLVMVVCVRRRAGGGGGVRLDRAEVAEGRLAGARRGGRRRRRRARASRQCPRPPVRSRRRYNVEAGGERFSSP